MVLQKKIFRTMKENKSQYIGSILLILISSMLFTSFTMSGENVKSSLKQFQINNVLEDASFIVQKPLTDIPSVESKYNVILEQRSSNDIAYAEGTVLRVLSETKKIDKYAIVSGNRLQHTKDIVVDQGFAKAHHLTVGNSIKIQNENFHVAGFLSEPDYIYPVKTESDMLKNPNTFGIAVISQADMSQLQKGLTFYSVKFKQDTQASFKQFLNQQNAIIQWVDKKDNNRISFVNGDIQSIIQIGRTLPITILLITIILVAIVLWRLLKRESIQIGTLYALGYRKNEILRHYLRYSIIVSAVGSMVGTLLGFFLLNPLLSAFSGFYNLPIITHHYSSTNIILSLLLPFLFFIPTTIGVLLFILRKSPLELMRGGANKTKVNWMERNLKLERFSFNTKFKLREVVRNIPRTILLIVGITLASMLLLLGFVMKDSMNYLMKDAYNSTIKYNYQYMFKTLQTAKPSTGEVLNVAPYNMANSTLKNNFIVYGIEPNATLIHLTDTKGNALSFHQVIMTQPLAKKLGLHKGDSISVINKLNNKKITLTIDAIATSYLGEFIYMPLEQLNKANDYPKGSFTMLISTNPINVDKNNLISSTSKKEMFDGYQVMIKPIQYMVGMAAGMAVVIGLIIIHIVTSLIIEENKTKISLLKVLGYRNKEIYRLLMASNTWLVILGYLISIPLILITMQNFFDAITQEININFPVKLNVLNMVFGFIIIFLTYEVSKWFNRRKVTRISLEESLKSVTE